MAVMHAEIERRIIDAGLVATFLRPRMFASNAQFWWGPAIRTGDVVRWPYAGAETALVDERDVAAVAARTLVEAGHAGSDYALTGPQSLSQAAQVGIIGAVLGRPIRMEEITPDEFRAQTAGSWPAPVVDMLLDAWRATIRHPGRHHGSGRHPRRPGAHVPRHGRSRHRGLPGTTIDVGTPPAPVRPSPQ
jgi:uncharacterized protein YbjT (DUF2867 family)